MNILSYLTSKTVWAGILAAIGIIGAALSKGEPITVSLIIQALAALLAAIGIKSAIVNAPNAQVKAGVINPNGTVVDPPVPDR